MHSYLKVLSSILAVLLLQAPTSAISQEVTSSICANGTTPAQIRVTQRQLQKLGFYKSKIDGQRGPGTIKAIKEVEKILGAFAQGASGCLSRDERLMLSTFSYGKKNKATCNVLNTPEELIQISDSLSKLGYGTSYASMSTQNIKSSGVYKSIVRSIIDYEAQVDDSYFNNTYFQRDCRLLPYEVKFLLEKISNDLEAVVDLAVDSQAALEEPTTYELVENAPEVVKTSPVLEQAKPQEAIAVEIPAEPIDVELKANTLLLKYSSEQLDGIMSYRLRLTVKGSEIDTSLVSKSIFGFENTSSFDISMNIGASNAFLDFKIDEENTKVNLHFSDQQNFNSALASNISELYIDEADTSGTFLIRINDNGSNNIETGDFRQILERLDPKDVALVGAFCSVIQSISVDKNMFIKSVTQNIPDESKDGFSSSPLVSDGVINIINSQATACVGELEKVNNIKASFGLPNLFDFEENGEILLENSSENILEKSRAELEIKEIAEQKRLAKQYAEEKRLAEEQRKKDEQRRAEEKQLADLAKVEKQEQLAKEKEMAERQNLEKLLESVGIKCTDSATTQFIDPSMQKQVNGIISRAIESTHKIGWLSKEKFIKSCGLSGVAMAVEFNTGNRLGYDWNSSFTGYKFISKKEWDNWPPAATCYEIKTQKVFKSDMYCGVKY